MLVAPLGLLTWQFLRGSGWFPSKYPSTALILILAGMAGWTAHDQRFYVDRSNLLIQVRNTYEIPGLNPYLLPEEVWDFQGVIGTHILWQQPRVVHAAVLTNPFVRGARVQTYFPRTVSVLVQEETPTLLWATGEGVFAVLSDGTARELPAVSYDAGLRELEYLTLFDLKGEATLNREPTHAIETAHLDPELVKTVLVLQQEYGSAPTADSEALTHFYYSQAHGLHLAIPNIGTRVFWGNGLQLSQKLANLRAIEEFVASNGQIAELIDVRPLTKPYYR